MALAEVLALITLVIAGGGAVARVAQARNRKKDREEEGLDRAMKALNTNDYRKIDDVLVMYADVLPKKVETHLSTRRDELYIEKNP